jgi:hypothetical protein
MRISTHCSGRSALAVTSPKHGTKSVRRRRGRNSLNGDSERNGARGVPTLSDRRRHPLLRPLIFPPLGRASPPPQLCGPMSASVGLRGLVEGRLAARPNGRSPA